MITIIYYSYNVILIIILDKNIITAINHITLTTLTDTTEHTLCFAYAQNLISI